jgi:hypothetical protein
MCKPVARCYIDWAITIMYPYPHNIWKESYKIETRSLFVYVLWVWNALNQLQTKPTVRSLSIFSLNSPLNGINLEPFSKDFRGEQLLMAIRNRLSAERLGMACSRGRATNLIHQTNVRLYMLSFSFLWAVGENLRPWLLQVLCNNLDGRAVAQTVSCRLSTAPAWVWAWVRSCGICVGQSTYWDMFSPSI